MYEIHATYNWMFPLHMLFIHIFSKYTALVVIVLLGPAFGQFPRAQKKKNGGAILHHPKNWAHKGQLPIF